MHGQRLLAVLLVVLGAFIFAGAAAGQKTIIVHPGESIQTAVNAAEPGDTIKVLAGTYRESVLITTDGLTIAGEGATLVPPAPGAEVGCTDPMDPSLVNGFCVFGDVNFETSEVLDFVKDVTIKGFTVRGFTGIGIIAVGAKDATFQSNKALHNQEYGIAAFVSTGTGIRSNLTAGSVVAGIYAGDSPHADVTIANNSTSGSLYGIFLRNALGGTVHGNRIRDNCVGILVLADAPGPAGEFDIDNNLIRDNDRACPGDDGPPLSGIGVFLFGATGVTLEDNRIIGNNAGGPTIVSAGVVLIEGFGGTAPTDNVVRHNVILRNDLDVFWDGSGTGNVFENNFCRTSIPAFICE